MEKVWKGYSLVQKFKEIITFSILNDKLDLQKLHCVTDCVSLESYMSASGGSVQNNQKLTIYC